MYSNIRPFQCSDQNPGPKGLERFYCIIIT